MQPNAAGKISRWFNKNILLRTAVIIFLASAQFSFISYISFHDIEPHWMSMYTFSCLGVFSQYITCYFILSRLNQMYAFVRNKLRSNRNSVESSKTFFIFFIAVFYTVGTCGYGLYSASIPPTVKKIDIIIKGLPRSLDGTTIALLSDIHMGTTVGKYKVDRAVNIVNELKAGIV